MYIYIYIYLFIYLFKRNPSTNCPSCGFQLFGGTLWRFLVTLGYPQRHYITMVEQSSIICYLRIS